MLAEETGCLSKGRHGRTGEDFLEFLPYILLNLQHILISVRYVVHR